MASNLRRHFADPYHSLVETAYSHYQPGRCSICLIKLAGLSGYGCYPCNIHVHRACAGYFGETTAFFAHPSHTLRLSRSPGRICDICRGNCPQESFVYRCIGCGFDVHPLCALLPERFGSTSPVHAGHDLCMVSSSSPGCCSACHRPMPMWRYVCSCSMELHIECAIEDRSTSAGKGTNDPAAIQGRSSYGAAVQGSQGAVSERGYGSPAGQGEGWYYVPAVTSAYNPAGQGSSYYSGPVIQGGYGYPMPIQGGYYGPAMTGGYGANSNGVFNNPSRLMSAIAKFLVDVAINVAASEFASQLMPSGEFS